MSSVAVIDYGMGNLRSVCKAIEHVAPKAVVRLATAARDIRAADRVVFPGQGAIGGCVQALEAGGMREALIDAIKTKPFLGLCLGLQALYEYSDEGGGTPTLGVLPGQVRRFSTAARAIKIPHMGWNQVHQVIPHRLWDGIGQDARFYFVHSYYADSADPASIAGTTQYAVQFTSAAARANIFAVQFHPEKSQRAGLRLLENFMSWDANG